MLLHFGFVDGDAEAGLGVGPHDASLFFNGEAFFHHILTPRHIVVHGLADDVTRLREAKLKRCSGAHGALRIVRRQRDAMCLGQGGDAFRGAESAAVCDVELADFDGAFFKHVFEGFQVRHTLATGHGRGERCIDPGKTVDAFRPAGLLEEIEAIVIESFAELQSHGR